MATNIAPRDPNFQPVIQGVDSATFTLPTNIAVNPTTHAMLVEGSFVVTPAGTQDVNITEVGGNAVTTTIPVSGTVTTTQGTSPWIVTGSGTAGASATGVITVQGITSMTPILATVTATDLDIRNLSQTQDAVLIYGSDDGGTTKRIIKTDSGGAIQVDLEVASVTVTNAAGVSAVNIQDGGNSITVDGTVAFSNSTIAVTNAGTFAVQATLAAETTKVIGTVNQGTSPWIISGTVTANAGINLNTSLLALEAGGNLATLVANQTNSTQIAKIGDGTNTTNVLKSDGTAAGQNALLVGGTGYSTATLTLSSGVLSTVWFDMLNYAWVSVSVLTNASGNSLQFQTSGDSSNTNPVPMNLISTSSANNNQVVSSTTATGTLHGARGGRYFRVLSTLAGGNTATLVITFYTNASTMGQAVLSTQNGTWTVGSNSATGSAVPANAFYQGISDGTNLRGALGAANALNSTGTGVPQAALVAQLDDTTPTVITENQFGNVRLDGARSLRVNPEGMKTTYSASITGLAPAVAATDIFLINGSASTTIRITRIQISGVATAAGAYVVQLIKRSTANSGGTSAAATIIPHDSNNAAGTAVVLSYTANPTTGTAVGVMQSKTITVSTAAGAIPIVPTVFDFELRGEQAIVLRGVAQGLAVNLNGATMTGGVLSLDITYTEEA